MTTLQIPQWADTRIKCNILIQDSKAEQELKYFLNTVKSYMYSKKRSEEIYTTL